MQVSSVSYSLNRRWSNTNPNISKNINTVQQVSFSGKDTYKKLAEKLVNLFMYNTDNSKLPKNLHDIRRTNDNHLLGFKFNLPDGKMLVVNKFFPDKNKPQFPYLAVKEYGNGAFKDIVGLKLDTQELIYLDKATVKPLYRLGELRTIPSYDDNHALHESRLESWLKAIFPEEVKSAEPPKAQQPKQKQIVTPTDVVKQPVSTVKQQVKAENPNPNKTVISGTNANSTEPELQVVKPAAEETHSPKSVSSNKVKRHRTKTAGRVAGFIDTEIQQDIKIINDIMDKLSKVREEHPSPFKRARVNDFRNNYEPLVYTNKRTNRGVTFKYGEGETLKANILERKPTKYLCIIHTDKDGDISHILIEDGQKVVINTKPTNTSFIPPKTIHCTKEEIKELPLAEYTKFLRENLEKYYSELNKVLDSDEPIKITPENHKTYKNHQAGQTDSTATNPTNAEIPDGIPQPGQSSVVSIPVVAAKSKFVPPLNSEELLARINPDGRDEKLVELINQKAAADAEKYAKQYMDTFTENFKRYIEEQMAKLREKFAEFFNN